MVRGFSFAVHYFLGMPVQGSGSLAFDSSTVTGNALLSRADDSLLAGGAPIGSVAHGANLGMVPPQPQMLASRSLQAEAENYPAG